MRALRAVIATLLLISALFVQMNADLVDDWASKQAPRDEPEPLALLGIQASEEWLVLQVEFPGSNFAHSKARALLTGADSAEDYIAQLTADQSTLSATLFDEVWQSPHGVKRWGEDVDGKRDAGADGNGAETLLAEVASDLLDGEDLSRWDLDNDGTVDRILILHSAQPQEKGGGANSFWSHFTSMQESLTLGEWTIEHFTIASIDSGLGTVVHEMLHQMGALDLYDVHSELPSSNWNGIGDWGLMASGNWNDNGKSPAMPAASTMDLIGIERSTIIAPNIDSTHSINGITDGGSSLEIAIAPNEWIRFTLRTDSGFDSALPGHGVLVEQQDRNNGNEDDNLVNTDPGTAWVKIIEADGDAALERARDTGAAGDVFSEGGQLGASGMEIRDSRGRLVPWTATIDNLTGTQATISFDFPETPSSVDVLSPRGPLEILGAEPIIATISADQSCDLLVDVHSSAASAQGGPRVVEITEGESSFELLPASEVDGSAGYVRGTVGCEGEHQWDIDLDWYSIGHRLDGERLTEVIAWDENSRISLVTSCSGSGSRTYSIAVEGALSRIATIRSQGELEACPIIVLDIEPAGLLTPGMVAEGELVFVDTFGLEQRIPVTLTAQSSFNGDSPLSWLVQPSNSIMVIMMLLAISVITGGKKRTISQPTEPDDSATESESDGPSGDLGW